MLEERGDPLSAVAELERAVSRDPGSALARMRLAGLLIESKRWADAEAALAALPAEGEHGANARRLRAYVAVEQGRLDDALRLLGEARAAGTDTPEVLAQQVRIRRRQNKLPEARALLDEGLPRFPDHADLAFLSAMLHQDAGDEARALETMIAVVGRFPKHAGALNFVGFSWAEQGVRLSEAEDYIRRALEVEPEDAAIIDSLGWVLFKRGDLEGAERHLRRALERMPEEGELHFHLGEVLWARGDRSAALIAFEKAVLLTDPATPAAAAYRARFEKRLATARRLHPKSKRGTPGKPR